MVQYVWERPGWPAWSWDTDQLLAVLPSVRRLQGGLLARVDSLLPAEVLSTLGGVLVEETMTNSAVEGEVLELTHVRSSVTRRLGLDSAGLPEPRHREQAVVDVMLDATQRHGQHLTAERFFSWQAALFPTGYSGLRKIAVGSWRKEDPMSVVSGHEGHETVHYVAPPSAQVPGEMGTFMEWWNSPPEHLDGLLRAALAHLWFLSIHPFEDGNGRLARVLTEMALSQDEDRALRIYSLSSRILECRNDYYTALERAQGSNGDVTDWLVWFLTTLKYAMEAGDRSLDGVLLRHRFWRNHRAMDMNARQRKALEKLLNVGPGGFEGGMTTRKYASINHTSKPTAYRELADLKDKGVLVVAGSGRSVRYEVNWSEGE